MFKQIKIMFGRDKDSCVFVIEILVQMKRAIRQIFGGPNTSEIHPEILLTGARSFHHHHL
jgi:hypothetical protein